MRVVVVQVGGGVAAAKSVPGSVCGSGGRGERLGGSGLGKETWISRRDKSEELRHAELTQRL